jgi:uncharacterized protein YndB with AHSA1/START domain
MKPTVHKVLPDDTIELERRIDAPPDTVFAFFTDSEKYRQWQGLEAELDPRPGGIFRVVQNEAGYVARGEFLEIDPPRRVVFSWGWEGIDGLLPGQSTVEVDLVDDRGSTLLRLRHNGLPSDSACQLHTYGWGVGLDALEVVLSERRA